MKANDENPNPLGTDAPLTSMNNELLTAWALNELSDEERAEIEAVLNAATRSCGKGGRTEELLRTAQ